MQENSCG